MTTDSAMTGAETPATDNLEENSSGNSGDSSGDGLSSKPSSKPAGNPAETCPFKPFRCAGRPRQEEVEARMHNLLKVAADLFLAQGYGKVSLETIAREAHVAVRTIYVKFGGKAGLFNAVIAGARERFFSGLSEMTTDNRPVEVVLADFAVLFLNMITTPQAIRLQRIVAAEAGHNPELARTFFEAGPAQTRGIVKRYFARPEIRALFRDSLSLDTLAIHLSNCLLGDAVARLISDPERQATPAEIDAKIRLGLDLFLHGTLKREHLPPA